MLIDLHFYFLMSSATEKIFPDWLTGRKNRQKREFQCHSSTFLCRSWHSVHIQGVLKKEQNILKEYNRNGKGEFTNQQLLKYSDIRFYYWPNPPNQHTTRNQLGILCWHDTSKILLFYSLNSYDLKLLYCFLEYSV